MSEFQATSGLLSELGDLDLKWNRVPAVKIWDYRNRNFKELSWHQIHRLGAGVVVNATLAPHVRGLKYPSLSDSPTNLLFHRPF